jgi:hypothetical protein
MYCPQCSQLQASESVRFCPRCGLPLEAVATIIANGGLVSVPPVFPQKPRFNRRTKQGAKWIFWSLATFPVILGLSIAADSPGPLFITFTLFLIGVFWMTYFKLFGDDSEQSLSRDITQLAARRQAGALPAAEALPAQDYVPPRSRTAEMSPPTSVVENTTRLLKDETNR